MWDTTFGEIVICSMLWHTLYLQAATSSTVKLEIEYCGKLHSPTRSLGCRKSRLYPVTGPLPEEVVQNQHSQAIGACSYDVIKYCSGKTKELCQASVQVDQRLTRLFMRKPVPTENTFSLASVPFLTKCSLSRLTELYWRTYISKVHVMTHALPHLLPD